MKSVNPALVLVVVPVACLALASCSGGGGGGNGQSNSTIDPPPVTNASPGGIWRGTTSDGQAVFGLVTESGEFSFLQADGVQYFCNMSVSGSAVSAGFTFVAPVGATFPGGATFGGGSLHATVAERDTLDGSITFDTATGAPAGAEKAGIDDSQPARSGGCGSSARSATASVSGNALARSPEKMLVRLAAASEEVPRPSSGTFSLSYDPLYDRDSSLASIAGSFSAPNGTVVTVDANGIIFSQDATNGCVVNGMASIIDASYNVYRIQYRYANCSGDLSALNGARFAGLATLDDSVVPEHAIVAVTSQSADAVLGVVEVLDRI